MNIEPQLLLIGVVAAVGILHTMVPDHWVPITLIARQRSWSKAETARAALVAGTGHVLSTLLIAGIVWLAGVAFAERFGSLVDTVSSLALIAFGGWIAISAWRELRRDGESHGHDHGFSYFHGHEPDGQAHGHGAQGQEHEGAHGHDHSFDDHEISPERDPLYAPLRGETAILTRHIHAHRHGRSSVHRHWHDHTPNSLHAVAAGIDVLPPLHDHRHKTTARTTLLLILGSSPMIEGIPAFFAAGRYGGGLIALMAAALAISTIATYVLLCVCSTTGLQRLRLGAFERYGEVLSGAFIALVGLAFWLRPML
jgi:hypothetical protein